jgi:predicted ester cyclase
VTLLGFLVARLELRYEVHDVIAADDRVAVRATGFGVHNADYLGFPATGKPFVMPTMHIYRAEGELLAEHWGVRNEVAVLHQIGALPVPPPLQVPVMHRAG